MSLQLHYVFSSSYLFSSVLSQKRIDLLSMLGVYVVMGIGIVVAFLTLIVEIVWKRRTKQKSINITERFVTRKQKVYYVLSLVTFAP